jgi:hypothetical protein
VELDTLEQGDILRIPVLAIIDQDPDTGAPSITELDTPTGACVVTTQTCDAVRELTIEPYLQVAPIRDLDEALWVRSRAGRLSPRYFALPELFGEIQRPVIDARLIATVDKRLVLDDQFRLVAKLLPANRGPFVEWLGRRSARYAFDDELEEQLLNPIRNRLAQRYDSDQIDGTLVRTIEGVFVSQADRAIKLLLLVEPGTKTTSQLDDDEKLGRAVKQLFKPIFVRAREHGWKLQTPAREASELSAFELLYEYQQVQLDLPLELEEPGIR